ncbi:MAG: nuclear transport factor 2 family protein, partial [Flavobacteriales bacterium]|nr:nuclear transport factor 2 family protein [Flavobacteriales bacterium]
RDCWNNGDLECFMETYWKSDSLKFIGKDGITYGWDATISRYKQKYPDKSHMGVLSFDVLEFEYLGRETIMLVGKWGLKRAMGDVGGHFTLIWRKMEGEWVIITDHTS